MGYIPYEKYISLKRDADAEFQNFLKKESEKKLLQQARQKEKLGGPSYYLLLLNKNSHLFTKVVIDAFRDGVIQPTQASSLLNTQINNFHKFESLLYE